MNINNAFVEFEEDEINTYPEIFELNIISGGCHLYGYLLTPDNLIAIAKWAHNPAIADQYNIDIENIFLVGHSMGGQSVLNAAKDLTF